jgi:hypothetical protein
MTNDYKETVNLKDKYGRPSSRPEQSFGVPQRQPERPVNQPPRAKEMEKTFEAKSEPIKNEFQKFNRPELPRLSGTMIRRILLGAGALIVIVAIFYFAGRKGKEPPVETKANNNQPVAEVQDLKWYAVKLANNEVYYGQISDIKSDPVVVTNVYYDYDMKNAASGEKTEEGSLRLVKRGKETHEPTGTMDVVRSQVLFMEPLKDDSKVLQAIKEYEKK